MEFKKDLVSVIIPVYNVDKYLYKCMMSLFNQTYKNLEIIVVNDGSTDNSGKILEDLKLFYDFILINKENGGLSSARNAGLDIATGEYIYFLDSDDWIDEGYIEEMLNRLKENPEYDLVHNSNVTNNYKHSSFSNIETDDAVIDPKKDTFFVFWGIWSCLFKSSLIQNNNIRYIEGYNNEDYAFQAMFVPYMNKSLFFYGNNAYNVTKREDSITAEYSRSGLPYDIIYQLDGVYNFYKERNLNANVPYFMLFMFLKGQKNEEEFLRKSLDMMKRHGLNLSELEFNEELKERRKEIFKEFGVC